jgi:transcriptional regulator GlxA family with amidase domain
VLAEEIVRDELGQQVVLDRLLDLLLVAALRVSFSRPGAEVPAWYRGDRVVGRALRMMQNDPGHPWTVAGLAAGAGVSRAALARRFNELVGELPMTFLTGWRMADGPRRRPAAGVRRPRAYRARSMLRFSPAAGATDTATVP